MRKIKVDNKKYSEEEFHEKFGNYFKTDKRCAKKFGINYLSFDDEKVLICKHQNPGFYFFDADNDDLVLKFFDTADIFLARAVDDEHFYKVVAKEKYDNIKKEIKDTLPLYKLKDTAYGDSSRRCYFKINGKYYFTRCVNQYDFLCDIAKNYTIKNSEIIDEMVEVVTPKTVKDGYHVPSYEQAF